MLTLFSVFSKNKACLKKISVALTAILFCVFLAARGEQAQGEDIRQSESEGTSLGSSEGSATAAPMWGPPQSTSERKDILSETEQVFDVYFDYSVRDADASTENFGRVLDTQFYQEEPVLLWLKEWEREVKVSENADGTWVTEMRPIEDGGLYLLRMDGSRELLIPAGDFLKENLFVKGNGVTSQQYSFALDDAGNCYARTNYQTEGARDHFLKVDREGEIVYKTVIEEGYYVKDFCTASDGRSYVVLGGSTPANKEITTRLVEFDPDTGELSQADTFCYRKQNIAATVGEGPDCMYYYTPSGYRRIEEDGNSTDYMLFQGSSYSRWTDESGWGSKDFRVLVDGSIEVLEAKNDFADGRRNYKVVKEKLWLSGSDKLRWWSGREPFLHG